MSVSKLFNLLISILSLSFLFTLSAQADSFPNFDKGGGGDWSGGYYRAISITNNAGVITDYQVAITPFTDISFLNNTGLVGSWHFSEGTGTTVADMSGNGNNGTWNGSNTHWTNSGRFGNAGQFNGTDVYVNAGNNISLVNNSFSLEAWTKRVSADAYHIIIGQGAVGKNKGLHFGFRDSNVFTMAFYDNDLNTAAVYTDTGWHHWVGTYDSSTRTRKIYRDGILVANDEASAHYQGSGELDIGRKPFKDGGGYFYFNGLIDEVNIYNRALSAGEIQNRYNCYLHKIRGDYADIRFAGSDTKTELSYWQETDNKFWVKIPNLPAGDSKIYMYYGNISATSSSNGTTTFDMFDGFDSYSGWTPVDGHAPAPTVSVSGGKLILEGTSQEGYIYKNGFKMTDGIIEFEATANNLQDGNDMYAVARRQNDSQYYDLGVNWADNNSARISRDPGWHEERPYTFGLGVTRTIRALLSGDLLKVYVDGEEKISIIDSTYPGAGNVGIGMDAYHESNGGYVKWTVDNFRVRKCLLPEPLVNYAQTELRPRNYVSFSNPTDIIKGKALRSGENIPQFKFALQFVKMANLNQPAAHMKRIRIDKYVPSGATPILDESIEVSLWSETTNNDQWDKQDTLLSKGKFQNGQCWLDMKRFEITVKPQIFYIVYNISPDNPAGQRAGAEIKDTSYLELDEPDVWVRVEQTMSYEEISVNDQPGPANQDEALANAWEKESSSKDYQVWSPYYDLVSKVVEADRDNLLWKVVFSYRRPLGRSLPGHVLGKHEKPPLVNASENTTVLPQAYDLIRTVKLVYPLKQEIENLIKLLGADDWVTREKATNNLITIGKPAVSLVKEAFNNNPDPEVRMRAKHILERIK